jgi:hypothetical protein
VSPLLDCDRLGVWILEAAAQCGDVAPDRGGRQHMPERQHLLQYPDGPEKNTAL